MLIIIVFRFGSDRTSGLLFLSCPLYIFPYSHSLLNFLILLLCYNSFLLFPCESGPITIVDEFHISYSPPILNGTCCTPTVQLQVNNVYSERIVVVVAHNYKRTAQAVLWARYCFSVHLAAFPILENKLIGYADDSTLMAVAPSLGVRVTVAESLKRDLGKDSDWCDLWGMKLNASKTKTMIVSRSLTMHPQSPPLTIGRTVLLESDGLVILQVTFDSKMTFEKHLRSVYRSASQRLGMLWNYWHYSLIDRFLGDAYGFFSSPQRGVQRQIYT